MDSYSIKNIKHLDTREAMRTRISTYLGSADTEGMYQALKEIINNSTDEALAGYGDRIEISIDESKNCFSVRDYGRSVPFGIDQDGKNILVAIYTEAHTGGKFSKDAYKNSSGLNGLGATAVCMSSKSFLVKSYRDHICATAEFEEGNLINYTEEKTNEPTGTYVKFTPDSKVFNIAERNLTYDDICKEMKLISYLNPKVHFILRKEEALKSIEEKEYYSENGVEDFISEIANKPLMKKPITAKATDGIDEVEIAFIWTGGYEQSYVFVNGLRCSEGGSPITGAKTTITTAIKRLSKQDFSPELIRKGLVYVINCKVSEPSFANQTKSRINNPNLRTLASKAFKDGLEEFSNTSEFNSIIDMMKNFQRAERAADRAREAVLESNNEIQKALKRKTVLVEKLADCRKHDETSQLLICEGKSAKGALVKSRNSDTTACLDIRGKLINALKNSDEKLSKNEEVKDIHTALGCGIGDKFDIKKLRYGRIGLAADMDKDGYAIVCLLLTYFYVFYPELIKAGKIYWCVTPLFKVVVGKKKYFAYNEEELKNLPKGDVTRLKGLGESQPEDFRDTIFSKDSRMVQFTMNDAQEASKYFDILLGENIEERRKYVFSHANFEDLDD